MTVRVLHMLLIIASMSCGTYGVQLHCTYVLGYNHYDGRQVYTCNGKFTSDGNNHRVIDVSGSHSHFGSYRHEDVGTLSMINESLTFFPEGIEQHFPKLKQILFSMNLIAVVTNGHLKPFRNSLQVLDLSDNEITEIESNIFDGLNKLKYVNFRSNKVKHVGLNIQLPVVIDFEDNPCINISYSNSSVGELKAGLERQCPLLTPTEVDLKHKINQLETKQETLSKQVTKLEKEILELKNTCLEAIETKLQDEIQIVGLTNQSVRQETNHTELEAIETKLQDEIQNVGVTNKSVRQEANHTELEAIETKLQDEIQNVGLPNKSVRQEANHTEIEEKVVDMNLNNLANETTGTSNESLKFDENHDKLRTYWLDLE